MNSWVNVTIPDRFSTRHQLSDEIAMMKAELEHLRKYIDYVEREFANIPVAIKDHGYVELSDSNGKFIMKIGQIP